MQILDQAQTTQHLPFPALISAIEQMFIDDCTVPLRHSHIIEGAEGNGDGTLILMPAWQRGKRIGIKTVSIFPGNQARHLPALHSVFILYDAATGKPLAILDGDVITSRRTAAASALAARWLSRPASHRLLVVGAGRVGSLLPAAFSSVRPIDTIQVWDIHREAATRLVTQLRAQGMAATVAPDLQSAAEQSDIISCATLSAAPLIHGEWLQPGTHLDLIGGFTPQMIESDVECFRKGTIFVDTEEALMKAGDILEAVKAQVFTPDDLAATLEDLCRQRHPGRRHEQEITVYKAVGTALEDVAAATLAFDSYAQHAITETGS